MNKRELCFIYISMVLALTILLGTAIIGQRRQNERMNDCLQKYTRVQCHALIYKLRSI